MAFHPGQILVDYSAANVRLFFRIYFIILGTTVGPLGKLCSSARVKLRLAKGKDVRLTRMLGWLGGLDTIITTWKIRTFPSGALLTLLMLLAYLVSIVSDLVGAYIRSVQVHDRCQFGTGLVLNSTPKLSLVPWNGYPYTVVSQAQARSMANDGQQGIYAKVNQDLFFSADNFDILGSWNCTQNAVQVVYSNQESSVDILKDLLSRDLLYSADSLAFVASNATSGVVEHLVAVDTSNEGTRGVSWDARICASTSEPGASTKAMLSFQCTLHDKVGWLTNILKGIDTQTTIPDWKQVFQGACYSGTGTPARPDVSSILERILNSMTMVASGDNYLLDSSQATSTQGCLTDRTWILWEVVALAAVAAFLNVFLACYFVFLKLWEAKCKGDDHYSPKSESRLDMRKELETVPGDLLGWAVHAIKESKTLAHTGVQTGEIETKDLKTWSFGWHHMKNRFGIVKPGDHAEEMRLLVNSR